jgi:hypothetical protein
MQSRDVNINASDICPVVTDTSADGINGGKNGGRICWAISGTFTDKSKGILAKKRFSCMTCDFFKLVEDQEGFIGLMILKPDQKIHMKSSFLIRAKSNHNQ